MSGIPAWRRATGAPPQTSPAVRRAAWPPEPLCPRPRCGCCGRSASIRRSCGSFFRESCIRSGCGILPPTGWMTGAWRRACWNCIRTGARCGCGFGSRCGRRSCTRCSRLRRFVTAIPSRWRGSRSASAGRSRWTAWIWSSMSCFHTRRRAACRLWKSTTVLTKYWT